MIVVC